MDSVSCQLNALRGYRQAHTTNSFCSSDAGSEASSELAAQERPPSIWEAPASISLNALRGYRQAAASFSDTGGSDPDMAYESGRVSAELTMSSQSDAYCKPLAEQHDGGGMLASQVDTIRRNIALAEAELDQFATAKREQTKEIANFKNIEVRRQSVLSRLFGEVRGAWAANLHLAVDKLSSLAAAIAPKQEQGVLISQP